jgi:hypothetical protein
MADLLETRGENPVRLPRLPPGERTPSASPRMPEDNGHGRLPCEQIP